MGRQAGSLSLRARPAAFGRTVSESLGGGVAPLGTAPPLILANAGPPPLLDRLAVGGGRGVGRANPAAAGVPVKQGRRGPQVEARAQYLLIVGLGRLPFGPRLGPLAGPAERVDVGGLRQRVHLHLTGYAVAAPRLQQQ